MIQVWVDKGRIRIKAPYGTQDVCKSIPGYRWDPASKTWHYPATQETAASVLDSFGSGELQATREFLQIAGRAKAAAEARGLKTATRDELEPIDGEVRESWLHQLRAHHFAAPSEAVMLGVGMGGGKSKIAIDLLEREDWEVDYCLIIAPANVVKVWPKEFAGAPEEGKVGHQHRPWNVVNGLRRNRKGRTVAMPIKDRIVEFDAALATASHAQPVAIVINYEALAQQKMREWVFKGGPNGEWPVVVLDESHRIKSPGGVQSKACDTLRTHARRRLCLTGTPMPHSPLDIYAQYRFLDPGVFGTSYARFRQKYAIMGGYQDKQVLGMNEMTAGELSERMAKLAFIISNEELDEVLGLLEPVWPDTRISELGEEARKAYDGMANDLMARIDAGTCDTNNALTQLLRLQQITSGHLPIEKLCETCDGDGCNDCSGRGFHVNIVQVGSEKLDDFSDWLSDIQPPIWAGSPFASGLLEPGEPVVVACRFTHDLEGIRKVAEKQGRRYGELSGKAGDYGFGPGLTDNALMNPNIDVLGVQIQSGGVGIDLTRARYVANFSVGFSLGDWLQWLKRTHRPGQTRRVVYQNFAVANTVDTALFAALAKREDVVKTVMKDAQEVLFS